MQPKHSAIVAGLTLALSFGAVSAPAPAAAEEPTPGVASDATDIDKGLYTQQSFSGVLRSVQGVSFVNVTPEMKYFTKYESHGNYNQGFSYGDGYNALGYYQFDRRWSLIPFMKQVYNYSPEKYSMLKDAIDRGSEISNTSNAMHENGQLTELGHIAQDAFQGAYNTDPVEFSALQDAYAYNSYYAVTEAWLKSALGIDISGRADCVKGMVWSITNMCGTGGCRDFFRWANLSNDMSDREFVTALSNSVVNNVATKFSSQPQYHEGWKNRYRNELKDCLVFIAEDEAAAATPEQPEQPEQPEPAPEPAPTPDSNDDPSDDASDDRMDAPSTDADGNGSAGGATNDGSTSNGSDLNGSAAGDSSSSSAGNTDSDASGSTDADTSNSSTGSSDSSVDTGSNNGSGSDATPDSDASKDDSNKAPDAPVASPDKKPSFSEQLGSTLGSSLMAGVNNGSAQNKDNSDQASTEKTEVAKGDSKDKASEKTESDKGSSSEEKDDKSTQKKDEDKKSESEEKDKSKTEDGKKQSEDDDSGADNQVQEQNDSKTATTTTTTTKSSGGNMPKTGDLIVMASLASASLATLGATSIVSGKHKLDQQKKASGEDGSEE